MRQLDLKYKKKDRSNNFWKGRLTKEEEDSNKCKIRNGKESNIKTRLEEKHFSPNKTEEEKDKG